MKQTFNSTLLKVAVVAMVLAAVGFVLLRPDAGRKFSRDLASAVSSGQTTVHLGRIPSPAWERVYVFGPYTSSAQISAAVGCAYSGPDTESSAGRNLLVFVSGQKIVFTVLHPRSEGEFADAAVGKNFAREAAVFTVSQQEESWRLLTPVATSPTAADLSPTTANSTGATNIP